MPNKIYALEGNWLGESYKELILPILERANISRVCERVISLADSRNALYLSSLDDEIDDIYIAVLDYHLWYYDDDTFYKYIKTIASRKFRAVSIFEHPFGWERPRIDIYSFEKKLYQRTETACNIFRSICPKTRIVSPAIRVLDESLQKRYLDYFLHHRNLFDVYAVHCCTEITDHLIGALATFLHQVLKVLTKPVWVTRWSVPSCDHKITSNFSIKATNWSQISSAEASIKLRTMYNTLNDVSRDEISWFFVGLDKDVYSPFSSPPDFWNLSRIYLSDDVSTVWMPEHFIGGISHDGKIKQHVINAFLDLAANGKHS